MMFLQHTLGRENPLTTRFLADKSKPGHKLQNLPQAISLQYHAARCP